MKTAVCVATYLRPVMLRELLASLAAITVRPEWRDIIVVVVDNDASGSARHFVEGLRSSFPWQLQYAVEPVRNIALARNRAVAIALDQGADYLAFIDDDEQVATTWLESLLQVAATHGADVVGGPVENVYEAGTPQWIVDHKLPTRDPIATGLTSAVPATSNVLVARRVFMLVRGYFDERFGRTGGSDSHFFLRARMAGATIAWAADAVVHETLPPSRTTVGWLLRRSYRVGNTAVFVAAAEQPIHRWLPRRIAAAFYRGGRGLIMMVPAVARGRAAVIMALQDLCLAGGALAGLAGHHYKEYDETHGA